MTEKDLLASIRALTIKNLGVAMAHQAALGAIVSGLSAEQRQSLSSTFRTAAESALSQLDDGPFSEELRAAIADSMNGLIREAGSE